ncbi:3-hydroxy-9,10-secoandrosta-1,3,5(10)-triene-9,17-dione monooxygenase reductase subunit [Saccharopolyspora endophytica]|uniref:Flavin reductase family protein n=1 Tax=Saccharopolyspora endophytica TaxID=543886 RepID=A0ABS5DBS4_9PSEU|nr:3-hydroxy-9,10-secoandrosta-1,3,5(10)-triene-9,17-dione monooxygenase reductase subunit [Saccharopolyspora endophytica]MBQ0923717.1 flavin reductase family protein [Saccharopolyspora endophytica]
MEAVVPEVDGAAFRRTLGHFCTGVTVVTAVCDGEPVGFACQSFSALSLDPPLVLFCPGKTSRTWPLIERAGHFCVNVLSAGQRDVSAVFGRRGEDKFADLDWTPAPSGAPVLDGALTWLDCAVESVLDGGDHHVVLGRVRTLGEATGEDPLLFYKGAYTGITRPTTPAQYWPEDFLTGTPEDWL